ncbi:ribosomal protein lysine methyltransferase Set11 [Schizosaccharomyces pombe]|uniref:Ribosomal lysine N-methyltransferase set11 n=1 Tax=Schizosaccharomyces pombe (strain 972 / ATCC 24843) TaxID=284812 RepID=SET11_SCHPO|nr:ribosomal protein lysine methyltransferase Set11 [Schizosaccharomyces pombe]O74405.1 RecName: Full=Ribosomal lysine N-methyltransferase set11; AltName: Full=Meiotically up-regulated gene 76 protein; AltName: Full=SET domain-containing protein 11 [Schizosaccharomyces pombe 972h-]CAA20873.1 ribosomal protein lysine methyltransferase Set11 [Schizosaccharomyces pombe]|eukprot:NP_588349.1 ribosomal protein lysine methyltransferase Set11 [Schizosaccharomyces pombe]
MSNKQNIESEVSWVKSKGAFVHPSLEFSVIPDAGSCVLANNDINENTVLLKLPPNILINKRTCSRYSFRDKLTSFQFLSWLISEDVHSNLEISPYYTKALPQGFSFHPVTLTSDHPLWSILPDEVRNSLLERKNVMAFDYEQVKKFVSVDQPTFQWGWLCVNTRCLYYDTGSKNTEDHLTLAPIFEYFNHSPEAQTALINTRGTITIKSTRRIDKGEQIFLCYGPHGNDKLFTEYGFCLSNNPNISIQLDRFIEFDKWQQSFLQDHGYWNDYTCSLHGASFRTLVGVRTLLVSPSEKLNDASYDQTRRVLQYINGFSDGSRDRQDVEDYLKKVLQELLCEAEECKEKVKGISDGSYVFICAEQLWKDRIMCCQYLMEHSFE